MRGTDEPEAETMSHNHAGPPSTSAYLSGCRDSMCVRAHDTYERTQPAPQIRAARVISTPTPIQTEDKATAPEPYVPPPWVAPAMVELSVVEPEDYTPRGYRGMAAIRSLRHTAGV
jgi:hypothetical protein